MADPVDLTAVREAAGSTRRLLRSDRMRLIADYAQESGSIRVGDLAARLGVTEVTIRRDLARLEKAGVLEREHGGAVALRAAERQFERRMDENSAAKRAIARRAAEMVTEGATIVIDSGSTTAQFARELRTKRDLTVITNAVTNASELAHNPDATIIMTGGSLRRSTLGTVGELAVSTLGGLRADHAFIATNGIGVDGLTYPSIDEVSVKRAMIAAAPLVTLLADPSKFDRVSLAVFAALDEIDAIVTTEQPGDELAVAIAEAGVELIIADGSEHR